MSNGIYSKLTGYPNRHSIRLPGYDYTQPGYYFVTMCIHDRKRNLFGDIIDKIMVPNEFGQYANHCWDEIPQHFPHVKLDACIVMPNHIHGIIRICDSPVSVGANNHSPDNFPVLNNHSPNANNNAPVPNNHSPNVNNDLPVSNDFVAMGANDYSPLQFNQTTPISDRPNGTSKTVGSIIRGFKIGVTKLVRQQIPDNVVWQRNYYEHIIRDEKSLFFIRKYIRENPVNWSNDSENHINREILEFEMVETTITSL